MYILLLFTSTTSPSLKDCLLVRRLDLLKFSDMIVLRYVEYYIYFKLLLYLCRRFSCYLLNVRFYHAIKQQQ